MPDSKMTRQNKMVSKYILLCLNEFKAFMVSVYCLYICGIFYIVISNKLILQIKYHTHKFYLHFLSHCFNQISSNIFQS